MTEKTQKIPTTQPQYGDAVITCSCGAVYHVGSTQPVMTVEICAACHPFYTGTQKFIDAAGRLERFNARVAAGKAHKDKVKTKNAKRKTEEQVKTDDGSSSQPEKQEIKS